MNFEKRRLPTVALWVLAVATGCSNDSGESQPSAAGATELTADTIGEQQVLSNAEYLELDEYATAQLEWGERLSMQCRACHSFEESGANLMGPALHGFFGRKAGSFEGFAYSVALQGADFVWTPPVLNAWLAQPADFLPGNKMIYAGLSKADDRRAVIAYLLGATE